MSTRIKRLLIILVGLIVLALAGGYIFLSSSSFRELARSKAEEAFNQRFRGELTLENLEWRPFSNSVVVEGLRIEAPETGDTEPAIRLRRALVNFSLGNLFSPRLDLQEVVLDGLNVRVWRESDDRFNLARAFERPGSSAPEQEEDDDETDIRPIIDLAIDHIQARDSQLYYNNDPIVLDTFEGSLEFRLDFQPIARSYAGRLQMETMRLAISGTELPALNLETEFDLEQTQVQFSTIRFRSPWLNGDMSGLLQGYETLQHRFDLNLQVEARTIADSFGMELPLQGLVNLTGTARGQRGDYGLVGRITGDTLGVGPVEIVNPAADFRLDQEGVDMNQFSGRFQQVPFEGAGQLWWSSERTSQVQVRAGSLGRHAVAEMLRSYATLSPSSQARGQVRFPGVSFSEWRGQGTLTIPGRLTDRPGFEPGPSYQLQSGWQGGGSSGITFSDCRIELEQTGVDCAGSFQGPDEFAFDFKYATQGSSEVVAWAKTWLPESEVAVRGPINGQGSLQRQDQSLSWTSRTEIRAVSLQGFELGALAATVVTGSEQPWRVNLDFSPQGPVRGELTAELDAEEMPLRSVQGRLEGELGPLLDQALELEESRAPAQIEASLSRTEDNQLGGSLSLSGENWTLANQDISQIQASAEFQNQVLEIRRLRAQLPGGGVLEVSGNVDLEDRSHRLQIAAHMVELASLTFLPEPLPISGALNLEGSSSGTQWPPEFSFQIEGQGLRFEQYQMGPFSAQMDHPANSDQAHFNGSLEFLDRPFTFQGNVGLTAPYPLNVRSDIGALPPELLFEFFFPERAEEMPAISGLIAGEVVLAADLVEPRIRDLQVRLSQLLLRSGDLEVRNQNPVTVSLQDDRLTLQEVTLEGSGASLLLRGSLRLQDDPELNFRVNGTAPLALANPFLDQSSAQGQAELQLVLAGTFSAPRIVGEANLSNASIQHPDLPTRLTDIKSRLRFTANQIAIEEFTAQTIYGVFEVEGGVFLDGFTPSRWFLNLTGQDLRVEYPENLYTVMDVDLDLSRGDGAPLLSGIVHVRSADYEQDLSLADLFFRYGQVTPVSGGGTDETEMNLNITVNAYRAIRIDNNLADVSASGDLRLRGTLSNPVLLGSLTVDEGRLFFERNEYRVVRGGVTFNDPRRTRPVVNFEAETEVQDYTVNILLNGRLDRLNVNFRSDPPLPTPNIVSLLALGQTGEDLFQGSADVRAGSLAVYGAGALLNQSLNERLQGQGNRLFGLDRISIDPFLSSAERDPGARVTLGKHLGNRLSVTYSTALGSETQGQIVVVQWKLTDWLTLVGTGEQNGALAIDFKLRRRF